MKSVSDEKLNYLVRRLVERITAAHGAAEDALNAHLQDRGNPHGVTLEQLTGQAGSLLELVYPVGAVYISASETSPAEIFGGSWERLSDCFLLSAGEKPLGASGGEWEHTLTPEELPEHSHIFAIGSNGAYDVVFDKQRTALNFECQEQYTRGCLDSSMMLPTGGNQPHNNLPPYRVVNMWQRVA